MTSKEINDQRTNIVAKSNDLIQKTTFNLTVTEQKFIAYVISLIRPEDKELQFYEIKVSDFAELCGYNPKNVYSDFKEMIDKLDEKTAWLTIKNGKHDTSFKFRWFSESKYVSNGTIRVLLNTEIKKYLLDLIRQGEYTQYDLFNILGLKSKYSIRLYELLKSYAYKGTVSYEVKDLKEILAAETYKSFTDFHERVLERSTKEINKYTDLDIKYSLYDKDNEKIDSKTKGRRISNITFKIKKKDSGNSYLVYRKVIDEIHKRNRQIKGQLEFDESMTLYEI